MSMCVVHEYWTFCIFVFVLFPFSFAVVHIIFTVHTVAWLLREYYNYNYCVCCHSRDCCLSFSIFLYLAPVCKSHHVCCLSFFLSLLLLLFSFERFEWASGKVGREKRVRRKIFPSVQIVCYWSAIFLNVSSSFSLIIKNTFVLACHNLRDIYNWIFEIFEILINLGENFH